MLGFVVSAAGMTLPETARFITGQFLIGFEAITD
jgi:hypothetical protein